MDDASLRERIETMVEEERKLHSSDDPDRRNRLAELKVELDQCWDLLRQREAHEEFGLNPDETSARDADTVEGYEQ
jgi:Protein of unknown function (DUF2630)